MAPVPPLHARPRCSGSFRPSDKHPYVHVAVDGALATSALLLRQVGNPADPPTLLLRRSGKARLPVCSRQGSRYAHPLSSLPPFTARPLHPRLMLPPRQGSPHGSPRTHSTPGCGETTPRCSRYGLPASFRSVLPAWHSHLPHGDVLPHPVPSVCPSVSRRPLFPPSSPVEGIHFIHGIVTTPRCLIPSAARFIRSACPVIQYRSSHCTALLRAARGKRYDTTDDAGTLAQISRPGAKKNCRRHPVLAAKSWVVLFASTAR